MFDSTRHTDPRWLPALILGAALVTGNSSAQTRAPLDPLSADERRVAESFHDDGMLIGRVGATAVNLPSKPLMTHVHNPMWRLDVDLDGSWGDSAAEMIHAESGLNGVDTHALIRTERGVVWSLPAFTGLHITDSVLKNAKSHTSGYLLMPWNAHGVSRHQEPFTQQDMWVTRYKWNEMDARYLPAYASPAESTMSEDNVLWYKGSIHHHPRDEDGEFIGNTWSGEAHIMWIGFMLMPFNLFDRTPLRLSIELSTLRSK